MSNFVRTDNSTTKPFEYIQNSAIFKENAEKNGQLHIMMQKMTLFFLTNAR